MESLKEGINLEGAKKLLGSQENAKEYLLVLEGLGGIRSLKTRILSKGKNKGMKVVDLSGTELWETVTRTWEYSKSKEAIREIFKRSKKYLDGKLAETKFQRLLLDWETLRLGPLKWPFSQGRFDEYVQSVNVGNENESKKDDIVSLGAIRFRRMKEINTARHDYIEYLIFEKHGNIIPTLSHRASTDFYVDGKSFDQKVSRSVTEEFKRDFGNNWRDRALDSPVTVAKYLYEYQDEGRFGSEPRLFVVYLDDDVTVERIRETIDKIDLQSPMEIVFSYNHKDGGEREYSTECFVILLHG